MHHDTVLDRENLQVKSLRKYPETGDAKSCSDKSLITKLTCSDNVNLNRHPFSLLLFVQITIRLEAAKSINDCISHTVH